jgi:hypothetical protein
VQGCEPYRGVFSSALMRLQQGNEGNITVAVSREERMVQSRSDVTRGVRGSWICQCGRAGKAAGWVQVEPRELLMTIKE